MFFNSFFELLSFKTKPKYDMIDVVDDEEYEFIILNNKMNR